jgi:hypothetical protein
MIEIFVILAVVFALFILFYRQAVEQYDILQIEAAQLSELPKLVSERLPVVIRSIGTPKLFTPDSLQQNKRLLTYPLGNQLTVQSYLAKPVSTVKLPKKAATVLANESGLRVWAEHTWFPKFMSIPLWEHIHSLSVEALIGEEGLRKTTAVSTLIYPTSAALDITVLTEHQEQFLPRTWKGRFPETFTLQDSPLVGEIKYITIKVRPGTLLCLPTHWICSIRASESDKDKPLLYGWIELHNPISWLANRLAAD